jgi:hypothetical protein
MDSLTPQRLSMNIWTGYGTFLPAANLATNDRYQGQSGPLERLLGEMTLEPKAEVQVQHAASGIRTRFIRRLQEEGGILVIGIGKGFK